MEITSTSTRYILLNDNGKLYYAEDVRARNKATVVMVNMIDGKLWAWDTLGNVADEYGYYYERFSKNPNEFFYKNSVIVNGKHIPIVFTVTSKKSGKQLNELEYERYFRNVKPQIEELI